jgi:hypothetical protein
MGAPNTGGDGTQDISRMDSDSDGRLLRAGTERFSESCRALLATYRRPFAGGGS